MEAEAPRGGDKAAEPSPCPHSFLTLFQDPPPHPKHLPLTSSSTQLALLISSYSAGTPTPTLVPTGPEPSPPKAAPTSGTLSARPLRGHPWGRLGD